MFFRHPEAADGLISEVELDDYRGLVADDKTIVARLDAKYLRRTEIEDAAVGEFHVDRAPCQEADMGVHTEVSAYLRLHVFRPPKAYRINHTLYVTISGGDDVKLHASGLAMFSSLDRR